MGFRFFAFIVLIGYLAQARVSECVWFYNSHTAQQSVIQTALRHQVDDLNWVNEQVVFYSGKLETDGRMKLSIPDGAKHWGSFYDGLANPNTLHGDPRHPMAILGPKLSYLMGYEVRPLDPKLGMNGPVEIISPGVELTQKTLEKINSALTAENKETIGLTIKKAGLVSDEEGLRLTLDTPKDAELSFPFHDASKELTPHEEAFHKTFTVPRELTRRARNINQAILGFHDLLKKQGLDAYAEFILETRWEQTDYASGTITSTLAEFNSSRLAKTLTQETATLHTQKLADLITIWFRPELTAFETLIQSLTLFDPKLHAYLQRHNPRWMENVMDKKNLPSGDGPEFVGNHYRGSEDVYPTILQMLKTYEVSLRTQVRPSLKPRRSAQIWAEDMLSSHENRISEITAALEKVLKEAGVMTATQSFSDSSR